MTSIVRNPTVVTATVEPHEQDSLELGQWYWVKDDDGSEWLGCLMHLGSNYAEIQNLYEGSERIHLDSFSERCRLESNAKQVIEGEVTKHQGEVRALMAEISAITARLGVGAAPAYLSQGQQETHALARLDPNQDVKAYKADLVKAKSEDLPALFKRIEKSNEAMARWMKAEILPMRAQTGQMKDVIGRINNRIFSIELYAGLTETIEQITDGEPAGMTEKVRLMQRRCYMDEECLAQYRVGGMEFKDIGEFDRWLAQPENLNRILPFPRCIVAFRVRRDPKRRAVPESLIGFLELLNKMATDELTFLYIRNGERLYRMNTELEFGPHLFPDTDHNKLTLGTKLWAKMFAGRVDRIITDAQYQGLLEDYEAAKQQHKVKEAAHKLAVKQWREAKKAAKEAGREFREHEPYLFSFSDRDPVDEHQPYEPDNIYYDDMQKKISAEIQQSNRIAVIIQGLLDRSVVLHPHPPWKIWSESEQALELVYDATRALVGGEKPDFEQYRQRLNQSLKVGSVTVGQRLAWKLGGEDEDGERRSRKKHYNDPGPGYLAQVTEFQRSKGRVGYAWYREGETQETYGKQIRVRFSCSVDQVLNVDDYKPGDFRQFFADPRTRAEYLEWAPLLLEAEEYHAGNRTVLEPPPPSKQNPSYEGQMAYRRRKERQQLVGKQVKLRRKVTTQGGAEYEEGSLWEVTSCAGGGLTISQLTDAGEEMPNGKCIRMMQPRDLVVVE